MKAEQNSAFFSPHKKHEEYCQHKLPLYVEYIHQVLAIFKDVAQLQRKTPSCVVFSHGYEESDALRKLSTLAIFFAASAFLAGARLPPQGPVPEPRPDAGQATNPTSPSSEKAEPPAPEE
ncbi:extensin, partial [Rhizobium leguminosarum bv. viciae]|nr:extensin [Rhizobium leguminosarum bv. viciae]